MLRSGKFPRLRLSDRFQRKRSFRKPKKLPASFIGEWPFGRVCVAAPVEAPLIVVMKAGVGQFGTRHQNKLSLKIREVTADFAVAGLELRHNTFIHGFEKALAGIQNLFADLRLKVLLKPIKGGVDLRLVTGGLHNFENAALDIDAPLNDPSTSSLAPNTPWNRLNFSLSSS